MPTCCWIARALRPAPQEHSNYIKPLALGVEALGPGEICCGIDESRSPFPLVIGCGWNTAHPCTASVCNVQGASVPDPGVPVYGSSIAVGVPMDATGTFTLDLASDPSGADMMCAPFFHCGPTETVPGFITITEPASTMEVVPVRASGVEGTDWVLGPGENEITLLENTGLCREVTSDRYDCIGEADTFAWNEQCSEIACELPAGTTGVLLLLELEKRAV